MKITKPELKEMIREAVKEKIATLKEGSDFTAKREVVQAAMNASMEFEKEIRTRLNLIDPDALPSNLQSKYLEIAEEMKQGVVQTVVDAVTRFASMPRNDQGENSGK